MCASMDICTHNTNVLVKFLHRYIIFNKYLYGALCALSHYDGASFVCLSSSCASISSNNQMVSQTSTKSKTKITTDEEDNNLTKNNTENVHNDHMMNFIQLTQE